MMRKISIGVGLIMLLIFSSVGFFNLKEYQVFAAASNGAEANLDVTKSKLASEPVIQVTIPEQPYKVVNGSKQILNFDFQFENKSNQKFKLDSIHLTILDEKGKPVLRKELNDRAISPSIDTVPNLILEPDGKLYLFNPFYTFEQELEIKTLLYEFQFSTSENQQLLAVNMKVEPFEYENKTNLTIPLQGRVLVEDGYDFYSHHRRVDLTHPFIEQIGAKTNPQMYALDLTVSGENGLPYSNKGEALEDWYGYGAPVYSTGSGTVLKIADGIPENTLEGGQVVYSEVVNNAENMETQLGNYLVIDHGNGEYSIFSHLKKDSFLVKEGDKVQQGQALAAIGFSGSTSNIVHIHYQLQTNPDVLNAKTVPAYFHNFRRYLGSKSIDIDYGPIDTGHIVESLPSLSK